MKSIGLQKVIDMFGCIPHPISFNNNLQRLAPLAMLLGVGVLEIQSVDIGILDGEEFTPIDEEETENYHINDLSMVIFTGE